MNFARSETALDINCQPGPLQQINQVTHWLGMISHKKFTNNNFWTQA